MSSRESIAVGLCLLIGLSLTACDELSCGPPDEAEFACQPVAPGTANTCGSVEWDGETFGEGQAFPTGCRVRLPACVRAHSSNVQTCDCVSLGSEPPQWSCPI